VIELRVNKVLFKIIGQYSFPITYEENGFYLRKFFVFPKEVVILENIAV